MTENHPSPNDKELTGPAKDFSAFIALEFERRRNSEKDFDPDLFQEAVELVLGKLEQSVLQGTR